MGGKRKAGGSDGLAVAAVRFGAPPWDLTRQSAKCLVLCHHRRLGNVWACGAWHASGIDDLHCPVVQVVRLRQRQLNYWCSYRSPLLSSFLPYVLLPIFPRSYTPCIAHPRTPSPNRNLPHLDKLCIHDVLFSPDLTGRSNIVRLRVRILP